MTPQSPHYGVLKDVREALKDAQSGLDYVIERYGKLDGVGFDRCKQNTDKALKRLASLLDNSKEVTRSAFEDWCKGRHSLKRNEFGFYENPRTDFAWEAWQASTLLHAAMRESK